MNLFRKNAERIKMGDCMKLSVSVTKTFYCQWQPIGNGPLHRDPQKKRQLYKSRTCNMSYREHSVFLCVLLT